MTTKLSLKDAPKPIANEDGSVTITPEGADFIDRWIAQVVASVVVTSREGK